MHPDYLIKMVNEIAAFFVGESGLERAPKDVLTHLKKYWDPRMRREMVAHYRKGGAGLSEVALAAAALLATETASAESLP
jgi:formate dehydrogenase subunit delta